jgi:hypothetical protein
MHRELYYLSAFMESTSYALPRLLILRAGAGNSYLPPNSKSVGLPAILISHSHVEASHHRARRASVRVFCWWKVVRDEWVDGAWWKQPQQDGRRQRRHPPSIPPIIAPNHDHPRPMLHLRKGHWE